MSIESIPGIASLDRHEETFSLLHDIFLKEPHNWNIETQLPIGSSKYALSNLVYGYL